MTDYQTKYDSVRNKPRKLKKAKEDSAVLLTALLDIPLEDNQDIRNLRDLVKLALRFCSDAAPTEMTAAAKTAQEKWEEDRQKDPEKKKPTEIHHDFPIAGLADSLIATGKSKISAAIDQACQKVLVTKEEHNDLTKGNIARADLVMVSSDA